jgi:hypothetical protein
MAIILPRYCRKKPQTRNLFLNSPNVSYIDVIRLRSILPALAIVCDTFIDIYGMLEIGDGDRRCWFVVVSVVSVEFCVETFACIALKNLYIVKFDVKSN